MTAVCFWLNGERVTVSGVSPTTTLLQYLRQDRHCTGTKEGCAEGDCGACTVAVLDPDASEGPTYRAVNACLILLPMVHGRQVITVEGLADRAGPHPVQEALTDALGSQCGYCTPGVIMSMFEACYRRDMDAPWKLDDQMCGNLCRCTGYRPIRDATGAIAGLSPDDRHRAALATSPADTASLGYTAGDQRFFAPVTFPELFDILDAHPDHVLIAGATDLGLDVTQRHVAFPTLVSVMRLAELRSMGAEGEGHRIGAAVRLTDLEAYAESTLPPVARMLRFFGSRQIKHRATLGGNLCNASPIGDLPPVLLALNATVVARSRAGERRIPIDTFFESYRKTSLRPGEVLVGVEIPSVPAGARAAAYKVSKRREMDISAVCASLVVLTDDDGIVTDARVAFGGMAATPMRAAGVEAALVGQPWTARTVQAAADKIPDDFSPIDDLRGSAWYRATVAANLVRGFYEETHEVRVPTLPDRPTATVLV